MERFLGTLSLLAVLLISGCGGDAPSDTAPDPTYGPSTSTAPSTGPVDFTLVALVSETAIGGEVAEQATQLSSDSLSDFTDQFSNDRMEAALSEEVADAAPSGGEELIGAVVSIGCDVPPGVAVEATGTGWTITPMKVKNPLQECLAAITTVALVTVPAEG